MELHRICACEKIARIAEEMSATGLAYHGVTTTIGMRVAEKLSIGHHNIDLEPEQRAALSLDDGPMLNIVIGGNFSDGGRRFRDAFNTLGDGVRERCWIGRILAREEWPTLLVCGANHSLSVEQLWLSLRLPVTLVHQDYEP